jgi:hypothetical protein
MTFLMISMLPTHLRASAGLATHFRGVVLHAGHERRRPKLEAVEAITFVYRCRTGVFGCRSRTCASAMSSSLTLGP